VAEMDCNDAAVLKLHTGETYKAVSDLGLQILGGYGYCMEYPMQRFFRDSRLAVIGGGPVGLELAQAFARLGSRVTIVEAADRVLPVADHEVSAVLRQVLEGEGITLHLSCQVESARRDGDSRQLFLTNGASVECERILVAAGRRPAVFGLGLDEAGVEYNAKAVVVDARLQLPLQGVQHEPFLRAPPRCQQDVR